MAQPLGIRTNVLSRTVTRSLCPRLHSPTIFFADTQSQFTVQYRSFSQSPIPNVKAGLMSAPQIKPKMPAEMSTRSRLKNIPPEQMPTDFGVLPGTFIKPDAKDMPSLFKNPRDRLRMEWIWIRHWVQNVIGTIYYHKWHANPRLPLQLRERREIGKSLHHGMYTQFARGNEQYLREKCSPGLASNLINRIRKRNQFEMIHWSLEKYHRTPGTYFTGVRVLSDRATMIPDLPDSGIRQIVMRIDSQQGTQTLSTARDPDGESPSPLKIQDCTEYIVIQKVKIAGFQKDWEVWGYTKPTTLEDLDSPWFATNLSFKERVEAMQDMMSGRQ